MGQMRKTSRAMQRCVKRKESGLYLEEIREVMREFIMNSRGRRHKVFVMGICPKCGSITFDSFYTVTMCAEYFDKYACPNCKGDEGISLHVTWEGLGKKDEVELIGFLESRSANGSFVVNRLQ